MDNSKRYSNIPLLFIVFLIAWLLVPPAFGQSSGNLGVVNIATVFSNISVNTTLAGSPASFNCLLTDNNNLSGFILSTDIPGHWENETWLPLSGRSAWANMTKIHNSTIGLVERYRWYGNDSNNNWGVSEIQTLTTTSVPPPPPPSQPPPPGVPVPSVILDILVEGVKFHQTLWSPNPHFSVFIFNKGTVSQDITFNYVVTDVANDQIIARGSQTIFITAKTGKTTIVHLPQLPDGSYTITVTAYDASGEGPLMVLSPIYGQLWFIMLLAVPSLLFIAFYLKFLR